MRKLEREENAASPICPECELPSAACDRIANLSHALEYLLVKGDAAREMAEETLREYGRSKLFRTPLIRPSHDKG